MEKSKLEIIEFIDNVDKIKKDEKYLEKYGKGLPQDVIKLFLCRIDLREKILKIIKLYMFNDQFYKFYIYNTINHEFLKEYREFINKKRELFPTFIFNDLVGQDFSKCFKYRMEGHTLVETEDFYINEIINSKRK